MNVRTFRDQKTWIGTSLAIIEQARTIALAGGQTPKPVYTDINPEDKEFFQTDERYVPADHPDSNQKMIRCYIPELIAFDTSLPIEKCLARYEALLPEQFDLVILGIGQDGHIASLFPHSPALHETKRRVAHTTTDMFKIHDRLTLTLPPILNSTSILVLLEGEKKAKILNELEHSEKSIEELPAKALLKHENLIIHYLK